MSSKYQSLIFGTLVVCASALCTSIGSAEEIYHKSGEIAVGGEGGWDCLAIDESARRLYVSHATKVVVIDLDKETTVGEVDDTPGVHAFVPAPDTGRGYSTNGRENKSSVVDLKSLKTLSKTATGANPDVGVYDSSRKEIYVFNGRGNSATVIDATTGNAVTTVTLPGKPEFAAVDEKAGRLYVNLEDKSAVAVVDTKTKQVLESWPTAPGEEPSGMGFDPVNHRLFLGCHNKMMVMMDSTSGKVLGNVPIGENVDGTAYDQDTHLAFSSNGDGTCTIAREESPDKLSVVQNLATEHGARTMTIDTKTHKIYLPSAKYEAAPPQVEGAPRQRPKIVPGSFKILVYAMNDKAAAPGK